MFYRNLDPIDFNILKLIQSDALLSYKEIAYRVNRSHNTVFERMRRLRDLGYVKATVALIDLDKIEKLLIAFVQVSLSVHTKEALDCFKDAVAPNPEVAFCYHVAGPYDFMLKIAVPDMRTYNEFIASKIMSLPNIKNINSLIALSETKNETAFHF